MPFERWGYKFRGPYPSSDSLQDIGGIYIILCKSEEDWTVLEVGETANVKEWVSNREGTSQWSQSCSGTVYYSAMYLHDTQQAERLKIAKEIRGLEKPVCGED